MKKLIVILSAAAGLFPVVMGCTGPKGDTGPATVSVGSLNGAVTDGASNAPVTGAVATAVGYPAFSATADANGGFTISNLPLGSYRFGASASGYTPAQSDFIGIVAGRQSTLNFALSVVPVTPAADRAPVVSLRRPHAGAGDHLRVGADHLQSGGLRPVPRRPAASQQLRRMEGIPPWERRQRAEEGSLALIERRALQSLSHGTGLRELPPAD